MNYIQIIFIYIFYNYTISFIFSSTYNYIIFNYFILTHNYVILYFFIIILYYIIIIADKRIAVEPAFGGFVVHERTRPPGL